MGVLPWYAQRLTSSCRTSAVDPGLLPFLYVLEDQMAVPAADPMVLSFLAPEYKTMFPSDCTISLYGPGLLDPLPLHQHNLLLSRRWIQTLESPWTHD